MCLDENKQITEPIGWQVAIDCYDCDSSIINDIESIKEIIQQTCNLIGAKIVLDNYYLFEPYGISAYAIITTSHISVHTWPEYKFASIDLFSCTGKLTPEVVNCIQDNLRAQTVEVQCFNRGKRRMDI